MVRARRARGRRMKTNVEEGEIKCFGLAGEVGLANAEWVMIDEADVSFGMYDDSFWFSPTNFLRSRISRND